MSETVTGGCFCGRVRFEAAIEDDEAYLCHCRMCQRATGNVSVAFKNVARDEVRWTATDPDLFASSEIAERGHCAQCGTSLSFAYIDSDRMDLTIGSFDDPARFRPTSHFGVEALHPAWLDTGELPRYRADEDEKLTNRWMTSVGKLPD